MYMNGLQLNYYIQRGIEMRTSRRKFVQSAATVAAVSNLAAQQTGSNSAGSVRGFDHVALPMQNTAAMLAFYRGLGFPVTENARACSVYVGDQMINFHQPATWQDPAFTLRAPAAKPPCGDLCFVYDGTTESLNAWLDKAGAKIVEGPGRAREDAGRALPACT
jgi:catechol 2,3-dioxygenase-like lactoylglutathione lyase family enzyme